MTPFSWALLILGVATCVATVPVVVRMITGPTILDRAVATDMLVVLVVIAMALYTAETRAAWAGPAMLAVTALAFIATITVARFVSRDQMHRSGGSDGVLHDGSVAIAGPTTHTGELEAIGGHDDHAEMIPDREAELTTPGDER